MSSAGHFITFEGVDGCGKSTQIQLLKTAMEAQGVCVSMMQEPLPEYKYGLLFRSNDKPVGCHIQPLIFLASMIENCGRHFPIDDKLHRITLCHRYVDSCYAYQGCGMQIGTDIISSLQKLYAQYLKEPELTIWLDVSLETARKRLAGRGTTLDYFEKLFDKQFYERVKGGYMELCDMYPNRIVRINAEGSTEEVYEKITQTLFERLPDVTF